MPKVIVPAGLSMGPRFRQATPPDPVPECHEVHLGDDLVELTEVEATVWSAAFADHDGHAALAVNRESLVDVLERASVPGPAKTVAALVERGLLVEFDTEGDLAPVFSGHRLFPLAQGLGGTPDAPDEHRIGPAGRPVLAVPNTVYGLWSFSFLSDSLWAACAYYAEGDAGLTAAGIAAEIAEHLPLLLATRCAFLDRTAPATAI
jgi:hypothetical protein